MDFSSFHITATQPSTAHSLRPLKHFSPQTLSSLALVVTAVLSWLFFDFIFSAEVSDSAVENFWLSAPSRPYLCLVGRQTLDFSSIRGRPQQCPT
jgi:hypothetical protein